MTRIKPRILAMVLCLVLALSIIPARASTSTDSFVTREQAIEKLFNTIGFGALNEVPGDLSAFSDFADVSEQYVDELGIAVNNGILLGTSNKTLNPKSNVTRLEFALIISRSARELPSFKNVLNFSDVPHYASGDVNRLVKAGIFYGYDNGEFGSNDFLTQDQLKILLERIENLSETKPQDDFYYFVNYDWLTTTKLPNGYPGLMAFDEVNLSNNNKLKVIVDDLVKNKASYQDDTKEQKMSDFYSTIIDTENRNKQGYSPIKQYLDRIDEAKSIKELLDAMARLENEIGINPLFSFSPSLDLKDSTRYSLYGSGLSTVLPSTYLVNENDQIKALYQGFIMQIFMLIGESQEEAINYATNLYAFEKLLAQSTMSNEQQSKIENVYNPTSLNELVLMFPHADVDQYIKHLGYEFIENVIITDPGLMKKTGELLAEENVKVLKDYAKYRLITSLASFLSEDFENVLDAFNRTFVGINSSLSKEDKAFNLLNSVMSGYLGRIYVEKYFSEEAKADVKSIVNDIVAAYQKRIEKLEWMSASTKEAAITKLKAMKVKIGYPDTWNDPLEGISIKDYSDGGSLISNILSMSAASSKYSKTLLSKPVDKSSWMIPPHMVNAFYSPTNNEIVFPAGILQAPFYDLKASREQNLGGIGHIIAHEVTHAFDNNGAQFDKDGNMNNWWTQEDYITFQQKCQSVANLYNGLEIAPNAVVNGNLTVSENIADIGGMACVLDVVKQIPNVNYKKFFESNATIWRMTGTNQLYTILATQDVHSPNKYRSNQVIRNFQEFYDTYDVKTDDAMYLAPENRVNIW